MGLLNATKHVYATFAAGMSENDSSRIDYPKLRLVFLDREGFPRYNTHNGEESSFGLPTLAAATCVVMGNVAFEPHDDRVGGTAAKQTTSREFGVPFGESIVNERVDGRHS